MRFFVVDLWFNERRNKSCVCRMLSFINTTMVGLLFIERERAVHNKNIPYYYHTSLMLSGCMTRRFLLSTCSLWYIHSISMHLIRILRYKQIIMKALNWKNEAQIFKQIIISSPICSPNILISVFERMVLVYCKEWNNTNSGLLWGTLWQNKWTLQRYWGGQMGHTDWSQRTS